MYFDNQVIEDLMKYSKKESKLFRDKGYLYKEEVKEQLKNKYKILYSLQKIEKI